MHYAFAKYAEGPELEDNPDTVRVCMMQLLFKCVGDPEWVCTMHLLDGEVLPMDLIRATRFAARCMLLASVSPADLIRRRLFVRLEIYNIIYTTPRLQ